MLNDVFQALGHADRRKILALIRQHGELNAGDLAGHFDFSKPTLSHHLKVLSEAQLLVRERRGHFIYFQVNQSVFEEIVGAMFDLFGLDQGDGVSPSAGVEELASDEV